jgi:hypothetical protein
MSTDKEPKINTDRSRSQQKRAVEIEDNRYKAQPVDGYQPLYKRLNKQFPTKNYRVED